MSAERPTAGRRLMRLSGAERKSLPETPQIPIFGRTMRPRDLLRTKPAGLYCPPGDFYIDPVRPVPRALHLVGFEDEGD